MISIDDYIMGIHNIVDSSKYINDLKFISGYYREINDYHTRMTFTLLQSTTLYPALKAGLEYYIRNKSTLKKSEKVFLIIRLSDIEVSESYIKIFIDPKLDISLVKEYLSDDELESVKGLLMELKLKK